MISSLITNLSLRYLAIDRLISSVGKFSLPTCGDDREPRQQLSSFTQPKPRSASSDWFDNASRRQITSIKIYDGRARLWLRDFGLTVSHCLGRLTNSMFGKQFSQPPPFGTVHPDDDNDIQVQRPKDAARKH